MTDAWPSLLQQQTVCGCAWVKMRQVVGLYFGVTPKIGIHGRIIARSVSPTFPTKAFADPVFLLQ